MNTMQKPSQTANKGNDLLADVIGRFSITSNARKATTTFYSNEKTSREIQANLLVDSDYHMDIQTHSIYEDEVMTVIYWRGECSVEKFLTIGSVRRVFLNAL